MSDEQEKKHKDLLIVIGLILIVAAIYFLLVDLTPVINIVQSQFPTMSPQDARFWAKIICILMIIGGAILCIDGARDRS